MKKIDMTHGPIGRKTIRFALLLALTGMLQQVFNTIDTIIMGQFVGKEAMAAVGSNTPIISLIVTFFIGISIGANVVISQMTGKGDREGVHRAVFSTLAFALAAGIVMACLSEAVAEPLLSLLQVPEALLPLSLAYLRIFSWLCRGSWSIILRLPSSEAREIRRRPSSVWRWQGSSRSSSATRWWRFFIRAWQLWRSLRHVRRFFLPPCW